MSAPLIIEKLTIFRDKWFKPVESQEDKSAPAIKKLSILKFKDKENVSV